jgi:protoporphyrinogen oxidase
VRTTLNATAIDIVLFEKDDRIGGRLFSRDFDGYRQELGADVCHLGNYFCVEFANMVRSPHSFLFI